MKFDISSNLHFPISEGKKSTARAVSFHPVQLKLCIAFRHDIYEYDLVTKSQLNRFIVQSEITHLEHGTNNSLIAALKNGSIHVWDLTTGTLAAIHNPGRKATTDKSPSFAFALNSQKPIAYYVRLKQATIQTLDFFSDSSKSKIEYSHKKPVSALATHPSREMLAVGGIDGSIKIWHTDNNSSKMSMDGNDVSEDKKKKKTPPSPITCLLFHPKKDILASSSQAGRVILWSIADKKVAKILGVAETEEWITSIEFHPNLPILICLTDKGIIKSLNISQVLPMNKRVAIAPEDQIEFMYTSLREEKYDLENLTPMIHFKMDARTGNLCFYGKRFNIDAKDDYPLFNVFDDHNPGSQFPLIAPFHTPLSIFTQEKNEFTFDVSSVYYLDTFSQIPNVLIKIYNIAKDEHTIIKKTFDNYHRCVRMVQKNHHLLLFFDTSSSESRFEYIYMNLESSEETKPMAGSDGCFLDDHRFMVLSNKTTLTIGSEVVTLGDPITRVFCSPYNSELILYHNSFFDALGYAFPANHKNKYQFDTSKGFYLRKGEILVNLYWHKEMVAVITTERVALLNLDLVILESYEAPKNSQTNFHSAIWVGNVLLFNTNSNVFSLSAHSRSHPVCTLDHPNSVLVGVLADRLLFVSRKKNTEISYRYLRIVEPLVLSVIMDDTRSHEDKTADLKLITSRFDCRYISEKTLSLLEQNGFAVLASELLSESQYTFSWELRYRLAKSSLNFNYALTIIKNQSEEVTISENSEYYTYVIELAKVSLDYGQFNIAAKCFEMIQDKWNLFRIFAFDHNEKALSWLASQCNQKLDLLSIRDACHLMLTGAPFEGHFDLEEDDSISNWVMKVDDIKDYELGREINGTIVCGEEVELIRNDLATWMGFLQGDDGELQSEQMDFNTEFKTDQMPSQRRISMLKTDSVESNTPTSLEVHSPRREGSTDAKSDEKDTESQIDKQEQARKAFAGESSSSDDDDDEEAKKQRAKKKMFQKIKIKDKADIKEAKEVGTLKMGLEEEEEEEKKPPIPRMKIVIKREEVEERDSPHAEPTPIPESTPLPEEKILPVKVNPTEALKAGMELLEKGQYIDAYKSIDSALRTLILDNTQIIRKNNILLCVRYKLMIQTLLNLQYLEGNKGSIADIANLATFLSLIEIPVAKHKVICSTMAIRRNIAAKNYGVAAKVLKELIPHAPETARDSLLNLYKQCESNNFSNESYDSTIRYCWKTFSPIKSIPLTCNYCQALFDPEKSEKDHKCLYCHYGKLEAE